MVSNEGSWESRPDLVLAPGVSFDNASDTFTSGGIGVVATGGSYDLHQFEALANQHHVGRPAAVSGEKRAVGGVGAARGYGTWAQA